MATLLAAEVTVFRDIVQAIQMGLAHSFSPDQRCIIFHNDTEGQNQPQLNHSATGRSPSRTFRAEMKLARRTLGKGLAAGSVLAGLSHLVGGESQPILTLPDTVTWKEIDPGVWRATIGQRWGSAVLITILFIGRGEAQRPLLDWAAVTSDQYRVYPDQSYGFFSGVALKLDVWQAQTTDPVPTVIYYHGGDWFFGDRTGALPYLMRWLAPGWNVVNVEYRMSGTALAPAAVEDARCAQRWVYRNANQFHLDTNRIIVTGHSAGASCSDGGHAERHGWPR